MLPPFLVDMNIADPVVGFLRASGVDVVSAREQGWGNLTDSEILSWAHAMSRFVLTHDSDFGTLAVAPRRTDHRNLVFAARRSTTG